MTPSPPLISRASSATTLTLDLRDAPPPALRTVLDVDPVALPPTPGSLLLPNVMIVGVSHAGATDLARALARHPQVKLPVVQRIDHYSPLRFGRHREAALADYDRHFASWSGQAYRLERSPVYFDGGPDLVDAVRRDLPGLRVLVVLRDPIERLHAAYLDKIGRGRLPQAMSFDAYVQAAMTLRRNGVDRFEGNRYFRALGTGLYADHLPAWTAAFPARTRVVFSDDLRSYPAATTTSVLTWLGLDPLDLRAPKRAVPPPDERAGQDPVRRSRWARLIRPSRPDRTRQRLEELYRPANRRLVAQLARLGVDPDTLPGWLSVEAGGAGPVRWDGGRRLPR